ncbi:MAG: hypothetical protein AAF772_10955 [Acidobacteriota bacterium]
MAVADAIRELSQQFERLIRRTIAPSVAFFVTFPAVFVAVGLFLVGFDDFGALWTDVIARLDAVPSGLRIPPSFLGLAWALLVFIGLSYVLGALHHLLFDLFLWKNHDFLEGWLDRGWRTLCARFGFNQGSRFSRLRQHVIKKLEHASKRLIEDREAGQHDWADWVACIGAQDWVDHYLYEVIGRIETGSTVSFVDEAKANGIVFAGILLSMVISTGLVLASPVAAQCTQADLQWLLAAAVAIWLLGWNIVRQQYRARNLRMYMNFLLMPSPVVDVTLFNDKDLRELLKMMPAPGEKPADDEKS